MIVNDSHRAGETKGNGPVRNLQRIFGVFHAAAQHRIDIDLENGVLRQPFQPRIQRFQTL